MLGAWEFAAQIGVGLRSLPPPSDVFVVLAFNMMNPLFMGKVFLSFANLMSGLVIAMFLAIPFAVFTGLKAKVDSALTPVVMLIGALPDLALLPLFVYWFGPGGVAAVFMATVASFFPLYFTTREGVQDIPRNYFHVAKIYRSSTINMYRKLVFPAIVPQIVTGARIAFDFVWEIVLAIEIFSQISGVGSFINLAVESGSISDAFAGIFMIGLIAILVDRIVFKSMERRIRRWHE